MCCCFTSTLTGAVSFPELCRCNTGSGCRDSKSTSCMGVVALNGCAVFCLRSACPALLPGACHCRHRHVCCSRHLQWPAARVAVRRQHAAAASGAGQPTCAHGGAGQLGPAGAGRRRPLAAAGPAAGRPPFHVPAEIALCNRHICVNITALRISMRCTCSSVASYVCCRAWPSLQSVVKHTCW